VVLEAQYNGIPVVALDQPAMSEAVGPGGVLVSGDLSDDEWARRIVEVWDGDEQAYEELEQKARAHGTRPEVQSDVIAQQVERALSEVAG
jgi:glycosyltransferase involved in cell wall biosynthesis